MEIDEDVQRLLADMHPAHFVLLTWTAGAISHIRDFLFAPYVMDRADWVRLD